MLAGHTEKILLSFKEDWEEMSFLSILRELWNKLSMKIKIIENKSILIDNCHSS